MRAVRWIGVSILVLVSSSGRSQDAQYTATVTAPEAEVRAGPSGEPAMYVTNRLRKGDRVTVVGERQSGWLAIVPPPGSFSWVHSRFVQQVVPGRPTWMVVCDQYATVPLLLGSNLKTDKPTVEGVKVKRGAQLRAVGSMKLSDDGYWLPVASPPGEIRFIRAAEVAKGTDTPAATTPPVTTPPVTAPPIGPPSVPESAVSGPPALPASSPGSVPAPLAPTAAPAAVAGTGDPRWQKAEDTEKAGRIPEAIQLYRQLGGDVVNTDHNLALRAYSRAQWLEDAQRRQNPAPATFPGNEARYPAAPNRVAPTPAAPAPAGLASSGPGVLQGAGQTIDYRPTFLLMNSKGLPMVYALPQPGISLESYVNRSVELYGTLQRRDDLRAWVMYVSQVRLLQ